MAGSRRSLAADRLDRPPGDGQADGVRTLLEEQVAVLADWLDEVPVSAHLGEPSGLGDWTVGELVSHLGLGIAVDHANAVHPVAPAAGLDQQGHDQHEI